MIHQSPRLNFLLFRGPWGPSMIVLDLSCFPGILWPIATNKEAIWQELLKFKSKKYEKVSFWYISKALMTNLGVPRPHHRADICIPWSKITTSFSCMGHNVKTFVFLVIRGTLGGPSIIRLGPSCFPVILSPMSIYMQNMETIR